MKTRLLALGMMLAVTALTALFLLPRRKADTTVPIRKAEQSVASVPRVTLERDNSAAPSSIANDPGAPEKESPQPTELELKLRRLEERYRSLPDSDDDETHDLRFYLLNEIARLDADPRELQDAILRLVSDHTYPSLSRGDAVSAAGEAIARLWAREPSMIGEGRERFLDDPNGRVQESLLIAAMNHKDSEWLDGLDEDLVWLHANTVHESVRALIAVNIPHVPSESGATIDTMMASLKDPATEVAALEGCRQALHNYGARPPEMRRLSETQHAQIMDALVAYANRPDLSYNRFERVRKILGEVAPEGLRAIDPVTWRRHNAEYEKSK